MTFYKQGFFRITSKSNDQLGRQTNTAYYDILLGKPDLI